MMVLAACILALAQADPEPRPSIVLVTIDTLRSDQLGCYGYPRPTSPRVDALAQQAVLFESAHAPMATTLPSHITILTGLYPHQHGHTSNRGGVRNPFRSEPGRMSAATALAAIGYRTAGFVSSVVLDGRTGVGAGFEVYDHPKLVVAKRPARETMERALAWLASVPEGQPFFLWVHLFDVHEPNEPEPQYLEALAPDATLREWVAKQGFDVDEIARRFGGNASVGARFFGQPAAAEAPARSQGPRGPRAPRVREKREPAQEPAPMPPIDAEALIGLHARYDACVRQVDDQVGRLIDALAASGSWKDTAFVFTADHGQSLGEHAHLGHGTNKQVNVRVPLLIRFPEGRVAQPSRNRAVVSLVDLMPTLLQALGIAGLEEYRSQFAGLDVLAPDFARDHVVTSEATEFHRGGKRPYECAVVTERWKYARAEGQPGRLFDLLGPGETRDVCGDHPEVVRELDALLAAELATSVLGESGEGQVDAERQALLDQLENLGYGGEDEDE